MRFNEVSVIFSSFYVLSKSSFSFNFFKLAFSLIGLCMQLKPRRFASLQYRSRLLQFHFTLVAVFFWNARSPLSDLFFAGIFNMDVRISKELKTFLHQSLHFFATIDHLFIYAKYLKHTDCSFLILHIIGSIKFIYISFGCSLSVTNSISL